MRDLTFEIYRAAWTAVLRAGLEATVSERVVATVAAALRELENSMVLDEQDSCILSIIAEELEGLV